jgi:hypothetical protein
VAALVSGAPAEAAVEVPSPPRPPSPPAHEGLRRVVIEPDDRGAAVKAADPIRVGATIDGAEVPESYTELDLDDVRGIDWDEAPVDERAASYEPTHRELQILAALWEHGVLFATQIHRRWWSGSTLRAAQQGLNKMTRAGWVRRCRFSTSQRGAQQRMYVLAQGGFELARQRMGPGGPYIDAKAEWREPQTHDPRRLLGDLHANGWVMALQALAPRSIVDWRGRRAARLLPPRRKVRGEWLDQRPQDVIVGSTRQLDGIDVPRFETVSPNGAVEVRLAVDGSPLRFDLLVELERGRRSAALEAKLQRYDAFITGWSRLLDRYKTLKTPPVVVFVAEDEPSALSLVKLADRVVTGRLAKVGEDEAKWPYPGRRGVFVVCERDVHLGSLAAYALPELPPDLREAREGKDARECRPRHVHLIEPKLLDLK